MSECHLNSIERHCYLPGNGEPCPTWILLQRQTSDRPFSPLIPANSTPEVRKSRRIHDFTQFLMRHAKLNLHKWANYTPDYAYAPWPINDACCANLRMNDLQGIHYWVKLTFEGEHNTHRTKSKKGTTAYQRTLIPQTILSKDKQQTANRYIPA